jgi:hypothetical protein
MSPTIQDTTAKLQKNHGTADSKIAAVETSIRLT